MKIYETGGKVRDELLGIENLDIDLVLHNTDGLSSSEIKKYLKDEGFIVYSEKMEWNTLRTVASKGHSKYSNMKIDFLIVNRDLKDEMMKKDFTINALLKDIDTGEIIDYFEGLTDLNERSLNTILDPILTFKSDPIRIIRTLRFMHTKQLAPTESVFNAIQDFDSNDFEVDYPRLVREFKKVNTNELFWILSVLNQYNSKIVDKIFNHIKLNPIVKKNESES